MFVKKLFGGLLFLVTAGLGGYLAEFFYRFMSSPHIPSVLAGGDPLLELEVAVFFLALGICIAGGTLFLMLSGLRLCFAAFFDADSNSWQVYKNAFEGSLLFLGAFFVPCMTMNDTIVFLFLTFGITSFAHSVIES